MTFDHLLTLSLHGELRRASTTDPPNQTINGKTAGNLLSAGLAEVAWEQQRPTGGPPLQWIRLSPLGRRRLDWYLERKL
jgi:hypothetical protein